jgi:hypothetical protein
LAIKAQAWVQPIWIDMPPMAREPQSFTQSLLNLLRGRYSGTIFHFESPAYRPPTDDKVVEARRLEQKLLNSAVGNMVVIHQDDYAAS